MAVNWSEQEECSNAIATLEIVIHFPLTCIARFHREHCYLYRTRRTVKITHAYHQTWPLYVDLLLANPEYSVDGGEFREIDRMTMSSKICGTSDVRWRISK